MGEEKQGGGGGGGFHRGNTRFFKVFLPGLNNEKLTLPPAFCAQQAMDVRPSGSACSQLVGPSGNVWPVELVKNREGRLLFEAGWKDFVRDHSLSTGEFLVFEYRGDLRFLVSVFDLTMCEKKEAFSAWPSQLAVSVVTGGSSLDGAEDVGEPAPVFLGRQQSRAAVATRRGSKRTPRAGHAGWVKGGGAAAAAAGKRGGERRVVATSPNTSRGVLDLRRSHGKGGRKVMVSQRRPVTREEIEMAHGKANSFKSKNPFFVIVMTNCGVYSSYNLKIPRSCCSYFPAKSRKMKLCVSKSNKGKTWPVAYIRRKACCCLGSGWRRFSLDNKLEQDDACVFERVKRGQFKVHIFRVVKEMAPLIPGWKP